MSNNNLLDNMTEKERLRALEKRTCDWKETAHCIGKLTADLNALQERITFLEKKDVDGPSSTPQGDVLEDRIEALHGRVVAFETSLRYIAEEQHVLARVAATERIVKALMKAEHHHANVLQVMLLGGSPEVKTSEGPGAGDTLLDEQIETSPREKRIVLDGSSLLEEHDEPTYPEGGGVPPVKAS